MNYDHPDSLETDLLVEHLQELKELYDAKYFRRTENNLPHLKFINGDKEDSVNNI